MCVCVQRDKLTVTPTLLDKQVNMLLDKQVNRKVSVLFCGCANLVRQHVKAFCGCGGRCECSCSCTRSYTRTATPKQNRSTCCLKSKCGRKLPVSFCGCGVGVRVYGFVQND